MKRISVSKSIALCLGICFSFASFASAQTPSPVAADTLLPSLAPKEVEVLGELEFDFPELRRPALSGFNPPPPVFEVPSGRRPFVEDYKQSGSDLPSSILRKPEPPAVQFAVSPVEYQGYTRLGYGRYGSSDGRAALSIPLSKTVRINFDGDHFGYRSFAVPDDTASSDVSRFLNSGKLSIDGARGAGIWSVFGSGIYNRIDLNGYPQSGEFDATILPYPDREVLGLDFGAKIESAYETTFPYSLAASYGGTRLQTKNRTENFDQDPRLRRAQKELKLEAGLAYMSDLGRFELEARSISLALDRDEFIKQDHAILDLTMGFKREYGKDFAASVGLSYLGFANFDNTDDPSATQNETGGKLAPMLRIDWVPNSRTRIYLENKARINPANLREMLRINPYQDSEPIHKAEYSIVNSLLGIDFYSKRFELNFYTGFEQVNDLQTYGSVGTSVAGIEPHNPRVLYVEQADIFKLGTEMTAFMTGSLSFNTKVEFRSGENIPYFPSLMTQSRISWAFANSKGHLSLLGGYIGSRVVDLDENLPRELPGFINLDLETSYFFSRNLGFYLSAKNLSNSDNEYWAGYFEPTFNLIGGVKLRW